MARSSCPERAVLDELARLLRGHITLGAELSGTLPAGKDLGDELVAEVKVIVRRKPSPVEAGTWHTAALAELREKPYKVLRCECYSHSVKRAWSLKKGSSCSNTVSHAVVYQGILDKAPRFIFTCGTHKSKNSLDAGCILGIVTFTRNELGEVRVLEEKHAHQRHLEQEAEDARREAERAARRAQP